MAVEAVEIGMKVFCWEKWLRCDGENSEFWIVQIGESCGDVIGCFSPQRTCPYNKKNLF
jgi:hypothetical protein